MGSWLRPPAGQWGSLLARERNMENTPTHIDFESEAYRARVHRDGLLQVFSLTPPVLIERSYDPSTGRSLEREVAPADGTAAGELARVLGGYPVLAAVAARRDPGWWHVDADAGFQRWSGMKRSEEIAWGLDQCGFEDYLGAITSWCEANPWDFSPRQA
jgi:hypothetical protein